MLLVAWPIHVGVGSHGRPLQALGSAGLPAQSSRVGDALGTLSVHAQSSRLSGPGGPLSQLLLSLQPGLKTAPT